MRVKLQETPIQLRRLVANKLESIRGTPMAPNSKGAYLGELACPIYRPDIEGIAYWEFEIAGLEKILPREHQGSSSGVGFMLASTGSHDLPVPHWSLTIEPPSRALEAKSPDAKVAKIIKLDTLAYTAEDEKGKYLTHLGQLPSQIIGVRGVLAKLQGISTVTAAPAKPSEDDAKPAELILNSTGANVPNLKLNPWRTWTAAKRGYAKAYQRHLEALAIRSTAAWDIEDLITKFGEGIHQGQSLNVPLLQAGKFSLSGEGEKFVKLTRLDLDPPVIRLEALPSETQKELSFQLDLAYRDGSSETLLFFIVPQGTPSNRRSTLPHFAINSEEGTIS